MSQPTNMKVNPDDENEVHDVLGFTDQGTCQITPVAQFPVGAAQAIVETLSGIVRAAHRSPTACRRNEYGITRAQTFEEGEVYMLAPPFEGYFADRYLMDFYDIDRRGICSRMHYHTGLRFVRMMTGIDTRIRASSLSPFNLTSVAGVTDLELSLFSDALPDVPEGHERTRYNIVVPPNSWVDLQIPRGTSHQFNAIGPNAVIDSVHPEESIETFREAISRPQMMAQTIFLADELPPSSTCRDLPA
jgi:hypothetical protein